MKISSPIPICAMKRAQNGGNYANRKDSKWGTLTG
jgi:hypothetical protein